MIRARLLYIIAMQCVGLVKCYSKFIKILSDEHKFKGHFARRQCGHFVTFASGKDQVAFRHRQAGSVETTVQRIDDRIRCKFPRFNVQSMKSRLGGNVSESKTNARINQVNI